MWLAGASTRDKGEAPAPTAGAREGTTTLYTPTADELASAKVPESSPEVFAKLPDDVRTLAATELKELVDGYRDAFVFLDVRRVSDPRTVVATINAQHRRQKEYYEKHRRLEHKYGVLHGSLDKQLAALTVTTPEIQPVNKVQLAPLCDPGYEAHCDECVPAELTGPLIQDACTLVPAFASYARIEYAEFHWVDSAVSPLHCAYAVKHIYSTATTFNVFEAECWESETRPSTHVCKSLTTNWSSEAWSNVCTQTGADGERTMYVDFLRDHVESTTVTASADCDHDWQSTGTRCNTDGTGPFHCGDGWQPDPNVPACGSAE